MNKKWYLKNGPQGDVVMSTRVRLARNLSDYPFPDQMNSAQRHEVVKRVCKALTEGNSALHNHFDRIDMEKCSRTQALSLVERHLISPNFVSNREGRALLLMKDESIGIMINEEDHLRIQVMKSGLDLDEAYGMADQIDHLLDEQVHYAFHERLGYLTQCPTNLGTGMRASLMLYLPSLEHSGMIGQLSNTISKLGLTIRGTYGEGTEARGSIYQISNQVTLGISERAALQNLSGIAGQIIEQERLRREAIAGDEKISDLIWRSLGILKYARTMGSEEFMKLISNVRLGVIMKMIPDISLESITELIVEAQSGNIMLEAAEEFDQSKRDQKRAELIRAKLA